MPGAPLEILMTIPGASLSDIIMVPGMLLAVLVGVYTRTSVIATPPYMWHVTTRDRRRQYIFI